MKNFYVFFSIVLFFVSLQAQAQNPVEKIDVHLNNGKLAELIKIIESKTGYHFYYQESLFDSLKITVDLEQATINDVLSKTFSGSDVSG